MLPSSLLQLHCIQQILVIIVKHGCIYSGHILLLLLGVLMMMIAVMILLLLNVEASSAAHVLASFTSDYVLPTHVLNAANTHVLLLSLHVAV